MWTIFVKLNYILDEPAWPALCEPIFGSMSLKVLATLSRLHVKGFISFSCMEHTLQTLNVNETLLWSWTTVFHWIAKYAKGFWNTFVETKQNIAGGNYPSDVIIYISPLVDTQPCLKDLHTPKAQRKRSNCNLKTDEKSDDDCWYISACQGVMGVRGEVDLIIRLSPCQSIITWQTLIMWPLILSYM